MFHPVSAQETATEHKEKACTFAHSTFARIQEMMVITKDQAQVLVNAYTRFTVMLFTMPVAGKVLSKDQTQTLVNAYASFTVVLNSVAVKDADVRTAFAHSANAVLRDVLDGFSIETGWVPTKPPRVEKLLRQ